MNRIISYLVATVIVLWILSSTLFVVDQRQYAIVFALGEVKEAVPKRAIFGQANFDAGYS